MGREGSVLLAIEQEVTAQIILAALRHAGYEAIHARDGFTAIRMLQEGDPSLFLVDVNISRPNSLELLRSIHNDQLARGLPIVGLVMPGEADLVSRARRLGVSRFVDRPFDPFALVAVVDEALGGAAG